MPLRLSIVESNSDFSTDTVPTSTGRPSAWCAAMSSTIASYFSRCVRKTVSGSSMRIRGLLVGTWITSSL